MRLVLALSFLSVALMSCGKFSELEQQLNDLADRGKLHKPKPPPDPSPPPVPVLNAGQEYFLATVYGELRKQCASCHTVQVPLFAVEDPKRSYDVAKTLLPDVLETYTNNGHHGLASAADGNARLAELIAEWARREGL